MQAYQLITHPATRPAVLQSIEARLWMEGDAILHIGWYLRGTDALVLPDATPLGESAGAGGQGKALKDNRADHLWQTTCFEIFLALPNDNISGENVPNDMAGNMAELSENSPYLEFNFAPSGQWNAYRFDGYRRFAEEWPMSQPPQSRLYHKGDDPGGDDPGGDVLCFEVALSCQDLPMNAPALGITAVIEEEGGHKSYWALAHAHQNAPDFHQASCFKASLPAPQLP